MSKPTPEQTPKPKPKPIETETGKQMDDNIDDLGRRPDGTQQDQPGAVKPMKD